MKNLIYNLIFFSKENNKMGKRCWKTWFFKNVLLLNTDASCFATYIRGFVLESTVKILPKYCAMIYKLLSDK